MNGQITCVEAVRHYVEKITAFSHLNAWLEVFEAEALEKQVQLASEVQLRMIPQTPPVIRGVDLAAEVAGGQHNRRALTAVVVAIAGIWLAVHMQCGDPSRLW